MAPRAAAAGGARKRILLVEDEAMIAMLVEDMLDDLGFETVGPALHLESALMLAESERLDAAILDVNMGEGRSYSVAAVLNSRGIPYIFATGYGAEGIEAGHSPAAVLQKPYLECEIDATLRAVLSSAGPAPA
jgi:DNA-binding response OmpR family regulator